MPRRLLIDRHVLALVLAAAISGWPGPVAVSAAGITTLDEARRHHAAGRLEQADRAYRAVLEGEGLDPSSRAVAHNNLCVVLDSLGDYREAEIACRRALELRRALADAPRLARTLNNLGLVQQRRGRYADAEKNLGEALAINREQGDAAGQAINLSNLGAVVLATGRYDEALALHDEVAEIASLHREAPWAEGQLATARLNRGVVLERLGAHREALSIYRDLIQESEALSLVQRASVRMNMGVVYRNLGDPVQAVADFERAETLYEDLGDLAAAAHARLNIGIARHLNLDEPGSAEASYRRALTTARRGGDHQVEIEARSFLGRLLLDRERRAEAREMFERCGLLARESGSAEGVWSCETGLGEVELAEGEPLQALDHFERAIESVEEGRGEAPVGGLRESYFADKRRAYSGAVLALAELDRSDDEGGYNARALEVAQRAKARDLLDALGSGSIETQEQRSLGALGVAEIERRLGEDVLLEYFVSAEDVFAWKVDGSGVQMFRVQGGPATLDSVRALHLELSSGQPPTPRSLATLSGSLLDALGSPPTSGQTVFVAPDRGLHYVPFELLPFDRDGRMLLEVATISYLPSAWGLRDPAGDHRAARRETGFLGLGGVMPGEGSRPSFLMAGLDLKPLPRSRDELRAVSRRFRGEPQVLIGEAATEKAFHETARRGAAVTHFATHTVVAQAGERGAAVLLSPGEGDDGLLYPSEIAASAVDSSLVVLAACSTAFAAAEDGRALTSITGSFLAAGAESVLATLWDVGDQPTAVFMSHFYDFLSRGLSPAEALRRTKLRFLADERWRAPHLWSGYVLVGAPPPLGGVFRTRPWVWLMALAAVLLVLAAAGAIARARA